LEIGNTSSPCVAAPINKEDSRLLAFCMTGGYYLCMTDTSNPGTPAEFGTLAFFAADHAVVESGKVYMNGGFFNRIGQVSYPVQISISLVAVLRPPPDAHLENHRFAIEMEDAGHNKLAFKLEGEFRVGRLPDLQPDDPLVMPIAIQLNGLTIERAGTYWFVLSVDGHEIDRFKIRAVQVGVVQPPPSHVFGGDSASQEE
jgi:hypothetical protein